MVGSLPTTTVGCGTHRWYQSERQAFKYSVSKMPTCRSPLSGSIGRGWRSARASASRPRRPGTELASRTSYEPLPGISSLMTDCGRHCLPPSMRRGALSQPAPRRPLLADSVAKVENQTTQKISRKQLDVFYGSNAPQEPIEGPWSFLCKTMWSLISPRAESISGPENFRSSARKDFFNSIPQEQTFVRPQRTREPSRRTIN